MLLCCVCLSGCLPVRYVTQASAGQAELLDRAVDIDEILRGRHLDVRTRKLLAEVPQIKAFGERHGLKPTKNYRKYVPLGRPAVVWVTSASSPLEFRSKAWTFPITGSITYLGWFRQKDADAFADDLRKQGWDVDVRGASAYSTLGWFEDPVLSSMIDEGDAALGELADVVLHESLHATYFVPGQSLLNESVAAFVGRRLASAYLDEFAGVDSLEKRAYEREEALAEARARAMKEAYFTLRDLYASARTDHAKMLEKQRILRELQHRTRLRRTINNATLVQYETYGSGVTELARLFDACEGSWQRFLRTLEAWRSELGRAEAHADPGRLLGPLLSRGCEAALKEP